MKFFHLKNLGLALVVVSLFLFGCSSNKLKQENIIEKFTSNGSYKTQTLNIAGIEYKQLLSGQAGKKGGMLVLGLGGTGPKTFNTWAATDGVSSAVASPMFNGLTERDPWTGKIIPNLAKSFETLEGGKKIIVHLRNGIQWSDGKEITSEDVLFTWNVILQQGFERLGARESLLVDGQFPTVTAPDKYTVIVETPRVFAPLLGELGYPIAPAHFFKPILQKAAQGLTPEKALEKQKQVFSTIWGTNIDPKTMVVSGPFKLSSYRIGERIEYIANPKYFVLDSEKQRLPYLQKLVYLIAPNDLEIFKFASGEIPLINLDPETLPLIKTIPIKKPYKIYDQGPSGTMTFVAFNMSRRGTVPKEVSLWFNNTNFRKALSVAIDRQSLINSIYQGIGSPLCLSTETNSIYFHKQLSKNCSGKGNLKLAEEILHKEGFRKGNDGLLKDKQNNIVRFSIYTNAGSATDANSPRELMAVLIKEEWKKLGIQVDLKVLEFNNLVVRIMQTGDWQTVIMGFGGGDLFEPNSSANTLYSNSRLHIFDQREQGKEVTDIRPWEEEIDNSLIQGTKYIDFEQRKNYYYKIQELIWKENPMIYLITPQVLLAAQTDNIGNFMPSKLTGATYNLEQWYFKNPQIKN